MTPKCRVVGWLLACGASTMVTGCPKPRVATSPPPRVAPADVLGPVAAPVPRAENRPGLSSTVTKVTVYSDRARVTRRAAASISTRPKVFAFRKLPGWVDDGSVRVVVTAGRIVGVRVERNFLARATDKNWQKVRANHRGLALARPWRRPPDPDRHWLVPPPRAEPDSARASR